MAAEDQNDAYDADRNRGIQNATSRFKRQREAQLTSSDLMRKGEAGRNSASPDDRSSRKEAGGERVARSERLNEKRATQAESLRAELERTGEFDADAGDAELLLENPPKKPQFPTIMVTLAVLKDILDVGDVTGVGMLVTTALSFLLALVLFLWVLGKMGGGWWKKKIIRKLWVKWGLATVIEFIPLGKIIPATTIFVLMVHYDESKVVKMLNGVLERMR